MVNLAQIRMLQAIPSRPAGCSKMPCPITRRPSNCRRGTRLRRFSETTATRFFATIRLGDHTAQPRPPKTWCERDRDEGLATAAEGCPLRLPSERDKRSPENGPRRQRPTGTGRSLLRQAVARGFRDSAGVSRNPRFEPIRDRDDVQTLLKSMSENPNRDGEPVDAE